MKTWLGTPHYMAPEITKKQAYGNKVDVWSVGVVAHTILTGQVPFTGKKNEDIWRSVQTDQPHFGGMRAALSSRAIYFVKECLMKNPEDRPSCEELLEHPWLQDNCDHPHVQEGTA